MDKKPLTNNLYHIKNLVMIYKNIYGQVLMMLLNDDEITSRHQDITEN